MEVRYHLDEHVARAVAVGLRLHGIDVTTTAESGLLGTSDVVQLSFASADKRVLVTHDRDFLKLHANAMEQAGIAYCHQDKLAVGSLIRSLLAVHGTSSAEDLRNKVAFSGFGVSPPRRFMISGGGPPRSRRVMMCRFESFAQRERAATIWGISAQRYVNRNRN